VGFASFFSHLDSGRILRCVVFPSLSLPRRPPSPASFFFLKELKWISPPFFPLRRVVRRLSFFLPFFGVVCLFFFSRRRQVPLIFSFLGKYQNGFCMSFFMDPPLLFFDARSPFFFPPNQLSRGIRALFPPLPLGGLFFLRNVVKIRPSFFLFFPFDGYANNVLVLFFLSSGLGLPSQLPSWRSSRRVDPLPFFFPASIFF